MTLFVNFAKGDVGAMKPLTQKERQSIARSMKKGYIQLLTQSIKDTAHIIDGLFFTEDDEEGDEIRPYFYGSLAFGLAVALFLYVVIG